MYASIRRYQAKDKSNTGEISRRAREGFVPIISTTPGFIAYYIIDTGDGEMASISVFDDQNGAEESTRRAADWVKQNMAGLFSGSPQITAGEVVAHKGK